ncbi:MULTISPECIES: ParB family protein [unclassified Serratia (in: enterobacteria)]|uniref:ParB family protein n=2 Tax=Serratia TaxID=613 RepID=UPI00307682C3
MTDPHHVIKEKLLAENFGRMGPEAHTLSDPIADTPMVVTLDQLRPYDLNPRVTRNPRYDEIKASIRERGLDTPPAITRRPGESHYIIRNGGNTRLAILRELWSETRNEQFFRIFCLFRPWPARGEIIALTGHLAESELHSGLTFIERALGVQKAQELYEQEAGGALSQTELARRLTADGYPIQQSYISRMRDAVTYLLPAIPTLLYGGLGRRQVERLATLRKSALYIQQQHATEHKSDVDFGILFHEILTLFDSDPAAFSIDRFQDELTGRMAETLGVDYDTLALEMDAPEGRQQILGSIPSARVPSVPPEDLFTPDNLPPVTYTASNAPATWPEPSTAPASPSVKSPASAPPVAAATAAPPAESETFRQEAASSRQETTPAPTTERLQSIQALISSHVTEGPPPFATTPLHPLPEQPGSLYPVQDIWFIEPSLDNPAALRSHIAQFAREIAAEAEQAHLIEACDRGIGFQCLMDEPVTECSAFGDVVIALLYRLSVHYLTASPINRACFTLLDNELATLLQGTPRTPSAIPRLSDAGLIRLFRLIRLSRRLIERDDTLPDQPD